MEIGKMMMGGKSEGKYAYYAQKRTPSDGPAHEDKVFNNTSNLLLYGSSIELLPSGDFQVRNPMSADFNAMNHAGLSAQEWENFATSIAGKYYGYSGVNLNHAIGRINRASYYYDNTFGASLDVEYFELTVSTTETKYGVTDDPNKYTTKTIGSDGFIYAKITGQTTV